MTDQAMGNDRGPILDYHHRHRAVPYAGALAYRSLRQRRAKSKHEWVVLLPFLVALVWLALGLFVRLFTAG